MTIAPRVLPVDALLAGLPAANAPVGGRAALRRSLAASNTKIAVIDDDPTGSQVASDVVVVTDWTDEELDWALADRGSLFFVITNSRSISGGCAASLNREIGERLALRAAAQGVSLRCVSRSDSTLRGHFPNEVDALVAGLKKGGEHIDGTILCPAFLSAGRLTVNDVHYIQEADQFIPVAETEFARDQTFGYESSDLADWAVERGVDRAHVRSIALRDLREGGVDYVVRQLQDLGGGLAIANAACEDDLVVLALGIDRLERQGMRFVYRTGPSFPAARAGLEPRPPLSPSEIRTGRGPGLLIVGSHTRLTTAQLGIARAEHDLAIVELHADRIDATEAEVRRCGEALRSALSQGDAALVTSRALVTGSSPAESLQIAGRVADAVVSVVASIPSSQPLGWVVAKGGITSSDIAARAFAARRARVTGQIFPNLVSVWQLGAGSTRPGIPYVVFPGNVGGERALSSTLATLRRSCH